VDLYTTKRKLMRPVTAWRRHRRAGHVDPFTLAVYESCDYRPSMRRFFLASRDDPGLLIDVDLPEGAVVLDVGAFHGEWTQRVLDRAAGRGPRDLRIHAFEPVPNAIRTFRDAIGEHPHVTLHEFGLAGRDRTESLSISGPGSSVFQDEHDPGSMAVREVALRDVDAVLTELEVARVDFVKINIEGGEFELIDRMHETGWLARTGTVIVQFHEFGPSAHRGRRRNRRQLSETHTCTWCFPWVYERWDPKVPTG
jgi:FkbM family methyltransferase